MKEKKIELKKKNVKQKYVFEFFFLTTFFFLCG